MNWAYFDESINERTSVMLVGGCIARQVAWEAFNVDWRNALAAEGVTEFHARLFYSRRGEFDWRRPDGKPDNARHNAFRDLLGHIIAHHVDEVLTYTQDVTVVASGRKSEKAAYQRAVANALFEASKLRAPEQHSMYMVFARRPDISQPALLAKFAQMNWENRIAGCGVFAPTEVLPLQAADYVLHACNRKWHGDETPAFKLLKRELGRRKKPFLMQLVPPKRFAAPEEG